MNNTTRFKVVVPEEHPDVVTDEYGNFFVMFDLHPHEDDIDAVAHSVAKSLMGNDYRPNRDYVLALIDEEFWSATPITFPHELNSEDFYELVWGMGSLEGIQHGNIGV
jgi:hypothetical protein